MIWNGKSLETGAGTQRQVVPDGIRSQAQRGGVDHGLMGLDCLLLLRLDLC